MTSKAVKVTLIIIAILVLISYVKKHPPGKDEPRILPTVVPSFHVQNPLGK